MRMFKSKSMMVTAASLLFLWSGSMHSTGFAQAFLVRSASLHHHVTTVTTASSKLHVVSLVPLRLAKKNSQSHAASQSQSHAASGKGFTKHKQDKDKQKQARKPVKNVKKQTVKAAATIQQANKEIIQKQDQQPPEPVKAAPVKASSKASRQSSPSLKAKASAQSSVTTAGGPSPRSSPSTTEDSTFMATGNLRDNLSDSPNYYLGDGSGYLDYYQEEYGKAKHEQLQDFINAPYGTMNPNNRRVHDYVILPRQNKKQTAQQHKEQQQQQQEEQQEEQQRQEQHQEQPQQEQQQELMIDNQQYQVYSHSPHAAESYGKAKYDQQDAFINSPYGTINPYETMMGVPAMQDRQQQQQEEANTPKQLYRYVRPKQEPTVTPQEEQTDIVQQSSQEVQPQEDETTKDLEPDTNQDQDQDQYFVVDRSRADMMIQTKEAAGNNQTEESQSPTGINEDSTSIDDVTTRDDTGMQEAIATEIQKNEKINPSTKMQSSNKDDATTAQSTATNQNNENQKQQLVPSMAGNKSKQAPKLRNNNQNKNIVEKANQASRDSPPMPSGPDANTNEQRPDDDGYGRSQYEHQEAFIHNPYGNMGQQPPQPMTETSTTSTTSSNQDETTSARATNDEDENEPEQYFYVNRPPNPMMDMANNNNNNLPPPNPTFHDTVSYPPPLVDGDYNTQSSMISHRETDWNQEQEYELKQQYELQQLHEQQHEQQQQLHERHRSMLEIDRSYFSSQPPQDAMEQQPPLQERKRQPLYEDEERGYGRAQYQEYESFIHDPWFWSMGRNKPPSFVQGGMPSSRDGPMEQSNAAPQETFVDHWMSPNEDTGGEGPDNDSDNMHNSERSVDVSQRMLEDTEDLYRSEVTAAAPQPPTREVAPEQVDSHQDVLDAYMDEMTPY